MTSGVEGGRSMCVSNVYVLNRERPDEVMHEVIALSQSEEMH